jgi:hypothetical protein
LKNRRWEKMEEGGGGGSESCGDQSGSQGWPSDLQGGFEDAGSLLESLRRVPDSRRSEASSPLPPWMAKRARLDWSEEAETDQPKVAESEGVVEVSSPSLSDGYAALWEASLKTGKEAKDSLSASGANQAPWLVAPCEAPGKRKPVEPSFPPWMKESGKSTGLPEWARGPRAQSVVWGGRAARVALPEPSGLVEAVGKSEVPKETFWSKPAKGGLCSRG